ncbi:MAG: polymerase III, subunit gamma and tau protein [Candidatus Falkowbacteria bacterium GW2011_GWC2_38_22]|uniref:DNA polymerase III subunit gamma/tau n=1 Tax=Candidatus Falkowbacteria bacterium GW2011_GWE1_38_31 TaxID=1618638 RepID=A0A0G0MAG0_9BACT|nr:MAG: polymerase III, subunit gamma and tau protein [Candidatus Falkowbacteria bacterium GW2011_GWF2_38_1205]KKQ61964.1 MAG: polymerase III, subunit gamma and tau protein [Candidatus Falkowbacteria bacterium GW2011_GWC2_38_22]KKQ63874.1 MAG: polymerase III, subunit gamma and tau protein [Candidatus Falkowbacteria bacterium GW2011_GWF1_38_22]KKQ66131.1 MAG: polymerase III, subunit gamma and tau protein [Candidatus Falkowbacteria bacterium GW2011_GWE2_38_254]KKQ70734.1 MAG: polymerase III, subu
MSTLYRSYRPQNFKEIVNQNHIKITLEHEISSGKIAHAYLFCGPRGIGKTTIARVFAKAVNCTERKDGEHEPCNKCDICVEINKNRNMDIIEIDAASHTGVDNVRDNIISVTRTAPGRSKYKVFIIDEVHMLSISAFNALLKILEEPPKEVIFILCTTEVHKIPATIISRCQRFDFKRISVVDIAKKLQYIAEQEKIEIDKSVLEAIARHSEGHMRDAESLLGQVIVIGGAKITQKEADLVIPRSDLGEAIKFIQSLFRNDAGTGIGIVNQLLNEGADLKRFLTDVIEILRKLMLIKINPALSEKLGLELGEAIEIKINEISREVELMRVTTIIEKLISTKDKIKGSFIAQLPLEIAVVEICNPMPAANRMPIPPRPQTPTAPRPEAQKIAQANMAANTAGIGQNIVGINKEALMAKWNEVLIHIKKHNHSLIFILRVCEPRDIVGNKLCLAFKYKFHKDRINDVSIKGIIEKVLLEVYGQPINVEAIVDENLDVEVVNEAKEDQATNAQPFLNTDNKAEDKKDNDDLIDNMLKTFGGKVIA